MAQNSDCNEHEGKILRSSPLPDGLKIGSNAYGRCLMTTKKFNKGTLLYTGRYIIVSDSSDYRFVQVGDEIYPISHVHSVQVCGSNKRQLYEFDCFMNHSCDPNTYSPGIGRTEISECKTFVYQFFDTVAIKDIEAGEEISTDYAMFDYTCNGHEIDPCLCKAQKCRGFMKGFRSLTLPQKVALMKDVDEDLIPQFQLDNPNVVMIEVDGSSLEAGLVRMEIPADEETVSLVATKDVDEGQLLFKSSCKRVVHPLLGESKVPDIICKVNGSYKLLSESGYYLLEGVPVVGLFSFLRSSSNALQTATVTCSLLFGENDEIICAVSAVRALNSGELLIFDKL